MTVDMLAAVVITLSLFPGVLYLANSLLFRSLPQSHSPELTLEPVSILIPARNEELRIAACVDAVRNNVGISLEIIVLDDHSTDRTAAIIHDIAKKDARVRLARSLPLPEQWNGKQHACYQLSKLASHSLFLFIDADVILSPDAVAKMVAYQKSNRIDLLSGFPHQLTGSFLEKLVLPLIHWLLLCYLPIVGMRLTRYSCFGAGCGQLFLTTRKAYEATAGHASICSSLHDGIALPRVYRRHGQKADLFDATPLARCRMYSSAASMWMGLAKNAHEGIGSFRAIIPWSILLLGGHLLPWIAFIVIGLPGLIAIFLSLAPRIHCAYRFRQSWLGAFLHPVGILVFVVIQWYALYRRLTRNPVYWKGRAPGVS